MTTILKTVYLVRMFPGLPGFERRFLIYANTGNFAIARIKELHGKKNTRRADYTAEPLGVAVEMGTFPAIFEVTKGN